MADSVLKYYVFPDNNAYSVSIPVSKSIIPIASVSATADQNNIVLLRVTVGSPGDRSVDLQLC